MFVFYLFCYAYNNKRNAYYYIIILIFANENLF